MPESESLMVSAADGYRLAATRYPAPSSPKAMVVVAGATAVPQRFYRRFAEYLAARGFCVVTFDYRGVGESAPASLVGFDMDYLDWGRLDLAAVIGAATRPGLPLLLVGHSYGGHALGLLPAGLRVDGLYTFGTGAGWHGWMPALEQLRVRVLWGVVAPALTAWKGFLPFRMLGMGEDLPLGVYRQWRQWCQYPNYFFDDPGTRSQLAGFARVTTPILAANATDDAWATPRSRDAFMAGYRQAPIETRDLVPARHGLKTIGHMGYFRASASGLWTHVVDWLDGRVAAFDAHAHPLPAPEAVPA